MCPAVLQGGPCAGREDKLGASCPSEENNLQSSSSSGRQVQMSAGNDPETSEKPHRHLWVQARRGAGWMHAV